MQRLIFTSKIEDIFSLNILHPKSTFSLCLVAQSYPTLCDPVDCSPPGSSVHEILQERIPEWVAISSSWGSSQPRDWTWVYSFSCISGRCFTHWAIMEANYHIPSKKRRHESQPGGTLLNLISCGTSHDVMFAYTKWIWPFLAQIFNGLFFHLMCAQMHNFICSHLCKKTCWLCRKLLFLLPHGTGVLNA